MSAPTMLANPEHRDEWLTARRSGIGASEIAAVMGISPWESPFSLYWRKVNGWEIEPSDEMRAGLLLEPAIAEWFATECDPLENLCVWPGGLYAHPARPWQIATPDRLIHLPCATCDGGPLEVAGLDGWGSCPSCATGINPEPVAVLELKYVAFSWDGWGEPGTDDIPVHYRAQVQWQCDVMDVAEWYLAALGPGGFRLYNGRRDAKDLRVMVAAGQQFMDRIVAGDAPDVDEHSATLVALKRLHPSIEDVDIEVSVEFAEGYRRARAAKARTEALVNRYEARARATLGSARRLLCGKRLVVSRSIYDQSGDSAELMAIDDAWPTTDRLNPGRAKSYVD